MILIGQWCNVLAPLPHSLSSAAAFWLVILDWITIINYSNLSSSFSILYCTYPLSTLSITNLPIVFGFLYLVGGDLSMFATGSALSSLFHSVSLVHFTQILTFLPFFHLLFSLWMTWLPYPASCSFTCRFKNKQGSSGFCVGSAALIWCGS